MTEGEAAASVTVRIPAQIRGLYGAQPREVVEAANVAQVVLALDARYPGIGQRLTEPDGSARRWVNFFVGGQDIRELSGMATTLSAGSELIIVPAVAGG